MRKNWRTNFEVQHRKLTSADFEEFIGLEDTVEKIILFLDSSMSSKEDRHRYGFLHGPSGSGKSAVFQGISEHFAKNSESTVVIPLSFNLTSRDRSKISPTQGLVLRIVEIFLCYEQSNDLFCLLRQNFIESPLASVSLVNLLSEISTILGGMKLLILIDEPGKANSDENEELEKGLGSAVLAATEGVRLEKNLAEKVFFIFSGLKPIYTNNNQLAKESRSGSEIWWFPVPSAEDVGISDTIALISKSGLLKLISAKMTTNNLRRVIEMTIIMSGGHWRSVVFCLRSLHSIAHKMKQIRLCTAMDVICQTGIAYFTDGVVDSAFPRILFAVVCNQKINPQDRFGKFPVAELSFGWALLNSFVAKGTEFQKIIPRISLLYALSWVERSLVNQELANVAGALQDLLLAAGTTVDPSKGSNDLYFSFEQTTAYFLRLKLLLLSMDYKEPGVRISLLGSSNAKKSLEKNTIPLLNGFIRLAGPNEEFFVDVSTPPEVVIIPHSFCVTKHNKEEQQDFVSRAIDSPILVDNLAEKLNRSSVVIIPGSKRQKDFDKLIVLRGNEEQKRLLCIQDKFSGATSGKKFVIKQLKTMIKGLFQERGILFDVSENVSAPKNQISACRFKEEEIVIVIFSFRELEPKMDDVPAKKRKRGEGETKRVAGFKTRVAELVTTLKFKGSIIIAPGREGCNAFFGTSFSNLEVLANPFCPRVNANLYRE